MRSLRTGVVAVVFASLLAASYPAALASNVARSTADRPGTPGLRVHLIYLVAKGQPDRKYDTNGTLARAADQLQAWFRRETGGRQMRLDTYFHGGRRVPDISFVRSPRTSFTCEFTSFSDTHCITDPVQKRVAGARRDAVDLVQADLAAAGHRDPLARYLVLVQGKAGGICGMAQQPEETDRDPKSVGQVAAVFLGDPFCPNDDPGAGGKVTWAMAHEFIHNDGAVPLGAPHGCPPTRDHVCTAALANGSPFTDALDPERVDVMYPSPGIPLTAARLDPGRDDYYGTTTGLRDLANSPYLTPPPR